MSSNDPARQDYEPYYEEPGEEHDRLVRCLQQQIEDCFTTISRIQRNGEDKLAWKDLRSGLRCWRASIRVLAKDAPGIRMVVR